MPGIYWSEERLKVHVIRRLSKIQSAYREVSWRSLHSPSLLLGSLIIELDNLTVQAFRSYAIMCVRRAQKVGIIPLMGDTLCGQRQYDYMLASAKAKASTKPGRQVKQIKKDVSPIAVRDPIILKDDIKLLTGSVPNGLLNAASIPYLPFSDLKNFRHFYAHRCEDTIAKVRKRVPQFVYPTFGHPDDFVDSAISGSAVKMFEKWTAGMINFFIVLAE